MASLVDLLPQYGPLFVIIGGLAAVLGAAFAFYKAGHNRHVKMLKERSKILEAENERLRSDGTELHRPLVKNLETQLAEAKERETEAEEEHADQKSEWLTELGNVQNECGSLRGTVQTLTEELEKAKDEVGEWERAEQSRMKLLKRAMKLQGKVWERKVFRGAPKFQPLTERHVAITSVLNLKGGVGKTTVAAHLAAALSAKGYRVLLVDLDLQGSLSGLFLSETALVERSKKNLLLQHFLLSMAERRKANLLECCVPILDGKSAIVPNADSMAYAELNLTMQWLLKLGKRDTRFLLRKALHQKRITKNFDIVILDCPPLFNTCCVNALAASDYVLIPTLPSKKATERVPLLLERLHSLHNVINPELQVMGAVLNRTFGSELTALETDLWRDMLEQSQTHWGLPVYDFRTNIRQTTEVRDCETEFTPPEVGSELYSVFSSLAAELEERLPRDCRRTPVTANDAR